MWIEDTGASVSMRMNAPPRGVVAGTGCKLMINVGTRCKSGERSSGGSRQAAVPAGRHKSSAAVKIRFSLRGRSRRRNGGIVSVRCVVSPVLGGEDSTAESCAASAGGFSPGGSAPADSSAAADDSTVAGSAAGGGMGSDVGGAFASGGAVEFVGSGMAGDQRCGVVSVDVGNLNWRC